MEKNSILEVTNLSFEYSGNQVLSHLNFKIYRGEYVGLIGANGSGKTTLLKLLLNLLSPSQGEILVFNSPLKSFKNWSKIGYVPQLVSSENLGFPITVKECIMLNYSNQKDESQKSALGGVLKITDTQNLQNKLLSDLSGGQRQRVFIARSLINNPELLILDEPTSGIDQESQLEFYKLLTKLNQDFGLTILFVSHDLETISGESSRILCIDKNRLEEKLPTLNHFHSHEIKESQIEHVHV
jgi:zinc transport system ATP-binding protein